MRTLDGKNVFAFSGDVKVYAEDFKARCDSIYAVSAVAGGKSAVEFIKGVGSVVLSNESGTARSKEMQILPDKSEIWLTGGATLTDDSAGMRLESPVIIMMREQNRGIAVSDAKDKNSFVKVFIAQAPDISAQTGRAHKGRAEPAVISSRRLNFLRDGKDLLFTFTDDVRIKSSDTDASCSQMDIEAVSAKGGGSAVIKKITARRSVEIVQKEYTAKSELATIYPRLKTAPDGNAKQPHRFVELAVSPDSPNIRPSVTLPSISNLGMEESAIAKKAKQEPTVITSDKQWLTSSADADRYFFEGNVDISGTDMKGGCEKIEVVMKSPKPDAKREISHIAMSDSVKLSQGLKDVSCGRADYYAAEEMLILADSPVVVNREDNTRASGHRIVYDKGTRRISVESQGAPPRGVPPTIAVPTAPAASEIEDDGEPPKRPTITIQTTHKR